MKPVSMETSWLDNVLLNKQLHSSNVSVYNFDVKCRFQPLKERKVTKDLPEGWKYPVNPPHHQTEQRTLTRFHSRRVFLFQV